MSQEIQTRLSASQLKAVLGDLLRGRRRIEFIPNPGNAGDALINAGAWQVFEELGVSGRIERPAGDRPADVYMYPGGGNFIPQYDNARQAITRRLDLPFDTFIVLPHTIRGNADLLQRFDSRFHVFCRDLQTFAHVRQHAPAAHAYLADDLAFLLQIEWVLSPWRRVIRSAQLASQPRRVRAYARWLRDAKFIKPVDGCLTILRVDTESAGGADTADPRLDLSARYGSNFAARGEAELVTADFLNVLDAAERVVTDRLHVGIGASLLGKDVLLLDNSYGKNRALYELSMRERFPKTRFQAAAAPAPATPVGDA